MVLVAALAQATTVEVKVPFPFVVRGQTMPAGQYQVTDEDGVIRIRGERGTHASMAVLSIPASGHDPKGDSPALTFKRHEQQYQLTQVWESGTRGREIHPS
jgi:hypothetical protein